MGAGRGHRKCGWAHSGGSKDINIINTPTARCCLRLARKRTKLHEKPPRWLGQHKERTSRRPGNTENQRYEKNQQQTRGERSGRVDSGTGRKIAKGEKKKRGRRRCHFGVRGEKSKKEKEKKTNQRMNLEGPMLHGASQTKLNMRGTAVPLRGSEKLGAGTKMAYRSLKKKITGPRNRGGDPGSKRQKCQEGLSFNLTG